MNYEERIMQKALELQRTLPHDIAATLKITTKPGQPITAADHMEAHSKVVVQYLAAEMVYTEKLKARIDELEERLDALAGPRDLVT